jgi:hypothetical protein
VTTDQTFLQDGAAAQRARYADLSQTYAAAGQARLAALAAWAADLQTVHLLLWESGLGEAPDPDAHLAAVATAVVESLSDQLGAGLAADPVDDTVRGAVESARRALVATFDSSVHEMLNDRFESLDHLDGLTPPSMAGMQRSLDRRLAGRAPHVLVSQLRIAAADCMAIAVAMARSGDLAGALLQVRQADLASFEAYLIDAALGFRDTALATVELRWDLAMLTDEPLQAEYELFAAAGELRSRLLDAVGPGEQPELSSYFEDLARLPV